MIETQRITEAMGGAAVLGQAIGSLSLLEAAVHQGLPKAALTQVVARAVADPGERRRLLHEIVPEATYKRRRVLSPQESERTERLARVVATADYVWDDTDDARHFLHEPHPMLEGRAPLEVALTELGARRVEDLLWSLFHGLPA
jgi:putative toxin-antitoxin system antitoxin component (TIGR02293 family)